MRSDIILLRNRDVGIVMTRLEHPTCLATCAVDMPASSMPIARSRNVLGILGIIKMLQCKKNFRRVFVHLTTMSVRQVKQIDRILHGTC